MLVYRVAESNLGKPKIQKVDIQDISFLTK